MSKVGNLGMGKGTLEQFNFPVISLQQLEHRVQMVEMILKGLAVHKNVIEKHQNTLNRGAKVVFMAYWKVLGAPVMPNTITLNSKWLGCV
jgi:hypothetical protein